MTQHQESIVALFMVFATSLAIGYGAGVRARRLPFTAAIGFSDRQWQFLRWWVKLALVAGILVPVLLLVQAWHQTDAREFWVIYLVTVAVQLVSERCFSQWLVPSVVVPIGFVYTAFRLWQLLDGFARFTWSPLISICFVMVGSFWAANLVMLTFMAIPTVFVVSSSTSNTRSIDSVR